MLLGKPEVSNSNTNTNILLINNIDIRCSYIRHYWAMPAVKESKAATLY